MKNNSAVVLLFLILISLTFLSSCNDSPVNPNTQTTFDSARYSWEKIDIPYEVRDFCAVDTNHIYFFEYWESGDNFITYIDRQFTSLSFTEPDFRPTCIGNVNNMVYIGGVNNKNGKPMVQKWNGAALENIPVPNYDTTFIPFFAFPMTNGEVWFTSGFGGNILRIAGNTTYRYQLDPSFYYSVIANINGEIYAEGSKNIEPIKTANMMRIYKFQSGTWSIAKEQIFNSGGELDLFNPFINPLQNHMYGQWGIGNIYEFDGSNLNKVLTLPEMIINNNAAGTGLNEFTFPGWRDKFYGSGDGSVFNWNGNKMSIELRHYQTGRPYTTYYKNNSYLVLSSTAGFAAFDILHIGKRN